MIIPHYYCISILFGFDSLMLPTCVSHQAVSITVYNISFANNTITDIGEKKKHGGKIYIYLSDFFSSLTLTG